MRSLANFTGLVLACTLAACSGAAGDPSAEAPTMMPDESAPSSGEPSLPMGEVPTELLESIVTDAAERAGVEPSAIQVRTAEAVTWSDGSLGCPQPGMSYTQALVPGYRVVLEVDGQELSFHAAESGDFRFCDDPQLPVEGTVDR